MCGGVDELHDEMAVISLQVIKNAWKFEFGWIEAKLEVAKRVCSASKE